MTRLIQSSAENGLIRLVLEKGARVDDAVKARGGRRPIQAAAEMGDLDLVKELHTRGADVNAPASYKFGRTALQATCNSNRVNMSVVRYLLENEGEVNADPAYEGGLTTLQGAAIRGHIGLALLLIGHGANVNAAPAAKHGRTALDGAAEYGRLDMVQILLNAGARCEIEGQSGYDSAVKFAQDRGHWAVADLLTRFKDQAQADIVI